LRGRPEAWAAHKKNQEIWSVSMRPDWSRGAHTLFRRGRGDTTEVHGPLQRLLEVTLTDCHCARATFAPQLKAT
jgi:hypothetical protein